MKTLAGRWGPVLLALAFGLLSIPLVAVSLFQAHMKSQTIVDASSMSWLDALILAVVSAVTAAVVGGTLGGNLVRSRPVAAALVAIATAWPIGIGMLSITAFALGIRLRMGISCIDVCTASINDGDPFSGIMAYWYSLILTYSLSFLSGAFFVVPAIACVLMVIGAWLAGRRRLVTAMAFVVAGYAALHWWSVHEGGVAFACLAFGVIVWATALHQPISALDDRLQVDDAGGDSLRADPSVGVVDGAEAPTDPA